MLSEIGIAIAINGAVHMYLYDCLVSRSFKLLSWGSCSDHLVRIAAPINTTAGVVLIGAASNRGRLSSSLGFKLKFQSEIMIEFGQASAFSRRLRSSSQMHRRNAFLFLMDSSSSPRRRRGFASKQLSTSIDNLFVTNSVTSPTVQDVFRLSIQKTDFYK